jgi:hypothetical protein
MGSQQVKWNSRRAIRLSFQTEPSNIAALQLYRACGFVPVEDLQTLALAPSARRHMTCDQPSSARHDRAFLARRGLDKYAGYTRPCAMAARDARNADETIKRPNRRALIRLIVPLSDLVA